jgi:hypothetical protein
VKRPKSDIPPEAVEVEVSEFRQESALIDPRVRDCVINGQVVGKRRYDSEGNLWRETPMKDGKKHGREYIWNENGDLESVEPYRNGKLHGLAKQYGRNGKVIGTYRFIRGTGYDIWRYERADGSIGISEIFSLKDGALDGYEWWPRDDQRSVWHERHWSRGQYHGIERMWNEKGGLKRGYPKYWIHGQPVIKRKYLQASRLDKALPLYREKDNQPQRKFPAEIEELFSR